MNRKEKERRENSKETARKRKEITKREQQEGNRNKGRGFKYSDVIVGFPNTRN